MPVATCRCRATETPRSTPRRASASPASVASLPASTGPVCRHRRPRHPAAEDRGHVDVLPVRQGRLHHLCRRSPARGPRPRCRPRGRRTGGGGSSAGPRRRPAPRCRARLPLLAVEHGAAPGQLEGGHGKRVVPQVDRERDRALRMRRGHAGRASPGARHLDRPARRPGWLSSSISCRPARSLTSTVAVPRARLSCLVSSARVSWPPPSWTARSSRARLCARNSALVVRRAFVLPHTYAHRAILPVRPRRPLRATSPSGSRRRSSRPGAGSGGRRTGCPGRRSHVRRSGRPSRPIPPIPRCPAACPG